ncbi:type VI secretion system lipoprotein TssJ [Entomohabitans teleogrylli]|uniref:type VI secretion system lipoprotein TssJ n=1 Tax=Entomohabitans teleogrylli TaxID=1384589 RepID=UPI00073D617F|nr:type VI secretion system lipoprotein TssJ [Entomohabitans teleogrylli]
MTPGRLLFRVAAVLLAVTLLSSCTTARKVGKVLANPDIQVGSTADQPSVVRITLLAEPDINKNESDEATPVNLQLVYLSEDSKLLAADFDQLNDEESDLSSILGKNYIDHQDYTLLPGQFKPLEPIELEKKNQYIGVIVYYADENIAEWKKIIKVKGMGRAYHLLVHVRAREIELQKEED